MLLILDTNVVSELMRPDPHSQVLGWAGAQSVADMAMTAITVMEIRSGIAYLPDGARKASLEVRFRQFLARGFGGRVLPFDEGAAEACAALRARRRRAGQSPATEDAMIAGIALQLGGTVVTRDREFDRYGVPAINPWEAL
jgi:hypothetical protein